MYILQLFQSQKPELKELNQKSDTVKAEISTPPKKRNPSRVRDHLANERTYLAWMRTSISLIGFGVVIARLRLFQPPMAAAPGNTWKLGLTFALVGLITVLLSTRRYFSVRYAIDEDTYEPADRWVILFSLAIVLLGSAVIYYFFNIPLNPLNNVIFE